MCQGFFRLVKWVVVLAILESAVPKTAPAHGTGYRILEQEQAVIVQCYYSDETAMAFARAYIFSPEDSGVEYQNARTDKNGRIAFFPDTPGIWQVNVSDGMGHKIQGQVLVKAGGNTEKTGRDQPSGRFYTALCVFLGISLIFNLYGLALGISAKKASPLASPPNRR